MKIGIIGAGQVGANLAYCFVRVGHDVKIANSRGPETLSEISKLSGARAVRMEEAVKDVELIALSIPFNRTPDLPKGLFTNVPAETVVIDTSNYYPTFRDGRMEDIDNGMIESAWVAKQIGHPVIKVFNNIGERLSTAGSPSGAPDRIALPVSGDDPKAKAVVIGLLDQIGFDGVDAGKIDDSWRHQPGSPGYGKDLNHAQWQKALSEADRSKLPAAREAMTERVQAYQAQKDADGSPFAWMKSHPPSPLNR